MSQLIDILLNPVNGVIRVFFDKVTDKFATKLKILIISKKVTKELSEYFEKKIKSKNEDEKRSFLGYLSRFNDSYQAPEKNQASPDIFQIF